MHIIEMFFYKKIDVRSDIKNAVENLDKKISNPFYRTKKKL